MDITPPGESEPETSSRPVLVTHRPMVLDPMVKDDAKEVVDIEEKTPEEPVVHGEKVIKPLSESEAAAPDESEESESDEPAKEESSSSAEATEDDGSSGDKGDLSSEALAKEEAAIVEAVADQATEDKKKKNKTSDEEKALQETVQKHIADKKYFVPIGKATRRRKNRRALVVLFLLILVTAGGYAAIDAGYIKTDIKLPIDIIKN